jgi:hypothetical protein
MTLLEALFCELVFLQGEKPHIFNWATKTLVHYFFLGGVALVELLMWSRCCFFGGGYSDVVASVLLPCQCLCFIFLFLFFIGCVYS